MKREPVTMSASPAASGLEQLAELGGDVLAVAVEPHRRRVALVARVLEPRLHRPADAEVERQRDDRGAVAGRDRGGVVRGAVVDHDDVEGRVERLDLVDHPADRPLLVVGRDDRDDAPVAHRRDRRLEPDELQQPPRAVRVGVLVEHALAGPRAHRLGVRRVGEQLAIGGERLGLVLDDDQLAARLEPLLDALVRVRDDRRARRPPARTGGTSRRAARSHASAASR